MDDTLDLPRFFRMVQAKNVMSAEDERARYFKDGQLTMPDKGASDAAKARYRELLVTWTEHDRLLDELREDSE